MLTPSRLVLARKRRGLSQKELAEQLGMSTRIIVAYEKGDSAPSEVSLNNISEILRFPVQFFSLPDPDVIPTNEVSFRALSRLSSKQREAALAISGIAIAFNSFLEEKFNLPTSDVPDFRGLDPESAAHALRAAWKIGNNCVPNMIHLVESKGIRVFSLSGDSKDLDAYCFWRKKTPYIFLNNEKTTERSIFDIAHELGHLVLHKHAGPSGREAEHEADNFAAAFLMPRDSVIANCPKFVTLENLVRLKSIWRVSVAALNFRLHKLGLTSDWHYKRLCISISEHGFHKSEPCPLPKESSQLLSKVSSALRSNGESLNQVTSLLSVYPEELNSFAFGLVMLPIQGGNSQSISAKSTNGSYRLELVKSDS